MAARPARLRYQTVIFDLDGTVSESAEGITRSIQYAFQRLGLPEPTRASLEVWIGPPLRENMARFLPPERIEAAVAFYRERYATLGILECRPYSGMLELLEALARAGARLRIATCKPQPFTGRILERFGIASLFDGVFSASLDGVLDRKHEVLAAAVAGLDDADRRSAVMIGDRAEDILAARQHGIASIAVGHGYGKPAELQAAGPDHLAAGPPELFELLLGAEDGPLLD